jgi:hypothetical protein
MLVDGLIARFGSWLGEEGAVVRVLDPRRFPAPWTVEKKACALLCTTTNGHPWRISISMMIWIITLQPNGSSPIGQAASRLIWRSYRSFCVWLERGLEE